MFHLFIYPALLPEEKLIFKTRPHWLTVLIPEAALAILGAFTLVYYAAYSPLQISDASLLSTLFGAAFCFVMILVLLDWLSTDYFLTDRRLVKEKGIIGRSVVSISLDRVQDVTYRFGIWGRIFNFGDIEIESAGTEGKIVFASLPRPRWLWGEIEKAIFALPSG